MSNDDMDTERSMAARMPKRPGNFGGETFREWCGLSCRRRRGKRKFTERGVAAQDVFRAAGGHAK